MREITFDVSKRKITGINFKITGKPTETKVKQ